MHLFMSSRNPTDNQNGFEYLKDWNFSGENLKQE